MKLAILSLLFLVLFPPQADAFERYRFLPVDEATQDKTFTEFRREFLQVVGRRDATALLRMVSPKIVTGYGTGRSDIKNFAHTWKLDTKESRDSPVWEELRRVVTAGGCFKEGVFMAPYIYAAWPSQFDSYDYLAVVQRNVGLKSEPRESSSTLEELSYEIVARADGLPRTKGWRAVRAYDGKTGYLTEQEARSPIDYRAGFRKEEGSWKLAFFLQGD